MGLALQIPGVRPVKSLDLFYQGEGLGDIEHLEVASDATFAAVKARLAEKHGTPADALIFLEDDDDPLDDDGRVGDRAGPTGLKIHLNRCRHIEVNVSFNGETVDRRFGPGATVARVKRWAAERKFEMSKEEAGEHVLQIAGIHDRPVPGTHVGALATCPDCTLAFDLVADERVNGSPAGAA